MDTISTFSPPVDSGIHFSGLNFLQILRGNRLKFLHCLDLISGKSTTSVSTFLDDFRANFEGKSSEALALSGFNFLQINYEGFGASAQPSGKGRPINAIPLEAAALYWQYWAAKRHPPAQAIIAAATAEFLTRRFDL